MKSCLILLLCFLQYAIGFEYGQCEYTSNLAYTRCSVYKTFRDDVNTWQTRNIGMELHYKFTPSSAMFVYCGVSQVLVLPYSLQPNTYTLQNNGGCMYLLSTQGQFLPQCELQFKPQLFNCNVERKLTQYMNVAPAQLQFIADASVKVENGIVTIDQFKNYTNSPTPSPTTPAPTLTPAPTSTIPTRSPSSTPSDASAILATITSTLLFVVMLL